MGDLTAAIPCSQAVRELWEYLDRSIAAQDQEKIEHHLSFCRQCCGELEFAKEIRRFLSMHSSEEIPHDARDRLERFVEEL